jgi:hypothetical protein
MWLKLRKWVFLNRIMEYKKKKSLIRDLRIKTLGDKKFFIPDNIHTNFRDQQHPDIKKSPYYVLAGLFKLKNISPEFAIKQTLTTQNNLYKQLEINKEKLEEIKAELKNNPDKFIDVWNSLLDKDFQKYYDEIEDKTLLEYEKPYRMRHEGLSITDTYPMKREWEDLRAKWTSYKQTVIELARKLTIDMLYEVIEKTEASEKSEDYQLLYEIVKKEDDDDMSFFNKTAEIQHNEKVKLLTENIRTTILDDQLYKLLDSEGLQNKQLSDLREKVYELTRSVLIQNLIDSNEKKFTFDELTKNIGKLFELESGETDSNFIEWLYVKYSSKNVFTNALKNSRATIITIIKDSIDNEIRLLSDKFIGSLKEGKMNVIASIYDKEKTMLEDLLKNYYELKLNLMNIEINEKLENYDTTIYSIDEFIEKLKDVTFIQLAQSKNKTIPQSLNTLLKDKEWSEAKERKLVELYVNLKNQLEVNSDSNLEDSFKALSKVMRRSSWFSQVQRYASEHKQTINLDDIIDSHNKRKLDENIENFMKSRFNEILYSQEDQQYILDPNYLRDLTTSKLNISNIEKLVSEYRNDKISLNEDVYSVEDRNRDYKIRLNDLKLKLVDAINRFHSRYDIDNLKLKYSDYVFSKDLYIYKVLCNIKDSKDIYNKVTDEDLEYGRLLLAIKNKVDSSFNDINMKKHHMNLYDLDYYNKVKNLSMQQDSHVEQLEKLYEFSKSNEEFKDLIHSQYFDQLDFTAKYDVSILLNNPKCDIKKLYNHIKEHFLTNKSKRIKLNHSDFLINELFTELLNDFEGKDKINHLNSLIVKAVKDDLASNKGSSATDLQKTVRRLITFEVMKAKGVLSEKEINLDNLTSAIFEKEVKAYDELVASNVITEEQRYSSKDEKIYLSDIAEYIELFNNDELNLNKKVQYLQPGNTKNLSASVLSSINSIKQLNSIKIDDKTNTAKNSIVSLKEYIKNEINPGLKYNKLVNLIIGKNKTLRDLVFDDEEMSPTEFLREHELDTIFSQKIPLDLIKTALDVYDARLIKALKLALVKYSQKTPHTTQLTKKETDLRIPFNIEEALKLRDELEINIKRNEANLLENPSEIPQDKLKRLASYIRNDQRDLDKVSQKISSEQGGEKTLIEYKKGSVFDIVLDLNSLPEQEKNEAVSFIIGSLRKTVNKPDFENKYSLIKYIYDYYMGTLSIFNENHKQDALVRMNNLNNVLFYNQAEQLYFSHENPNTKTGMISFLNTKAWERHLDPYKNEPISYSDEINFEKQYETTNEQDRRPSDEEKALAGVDPKQLKGVERMENYTFGKPFRSHPENWNWLPKNDPRSKFLDIKLKKAWKVWMYQNMKTEGTLDENLRANSAEALYLTEEFRVQTEQVAHHNKTLEKEVHNLYDSKDSSPVFNKLLNEKNPFDNVFEEMFSDYFRKKKERLEYTNEQLQVLKENYSHSENIILGNQELQNTMEFKKSNKDDNNNIKLDLNTFIKVNSAMKEYPTFNASDITEIVELDNASSFAQYGKLANIPHWLLKEEQKEDKPFHFNQSSDDWYEKQIETIVNEFFDKRFGIEKCVTREELRAIDKELSSHLIFENINEKVKNRLANERILMHYLQDVYEGYRNGSSDYRVQQRKINLDQHKLNKEMKDPDAYYKLQAYQLRKQYDYNKALEDYLSTKKTKSLRHIRKFDRDLQANKDDYSFSNYYEANLYNSQFRENKKETNFVQRKEMATLFGGSQFEEFSTEKDKKAHTQQLIETVMINPFKSNS